MAQFLDALQQVVAALDAVGATYYIGGSIASIAHGVPRTTLDVDLVAELRPAQVERFVEYLQGRFYLHSADINDAIEQRSSFNLIHLASMVKVAIFLAPDRPFDRSKAQRATVGLLVPGSDHRFSLTSPEDIVLQKLEWYVQGGRVSERQWLDSLGVLKIQRHALDLAYLRRWAAELGVAELLEQALLDAGLDRE
jgi:hypothetical protein